jgi:hypothetical protein
MFARYGPNKAIRTVLTEFCSANSFRNPPHLERSASSEGGARGAGCDASHQQCRLRGLPGRDLGTEHERCARRDGGQLLWPPGADPRLEACSRRGGRRHHRQQLSMAGDQLPPHLILRPRLVHWGSVTQTSLSFGDAQPRLSLASQARRRRNHAPRRPFPRHGRIQVRSADHAPKQRRRDYVWRGGGVGTFIPWRAATAGAAERSAAARKRPHPRRTARRCRCLPRLGADRGPFAEAVNHQTNRVSRKRMVIAALGLYDRL